MGRMIADKFRKRIGVSLEIISFTPKVEFLLGVRYELADLIEAVERWMSRGDGAWPKEELNIEDALTALREKMEELE